MTGGGWIFLVGFMGAGKTTLGDKVARRLSMPFYDLDDRIEQEQRQDVPTMFASGGEEAFRRIETHALENLLRKREPAGVVATGGGAFTIEANRSLMASAGISVWLDAPFEAVAARVAGTDRPLASDDAELRGLFERRKRFYASADLHLTLGADSVEHNAAALFRLLSLHLGNS